MTKNIQFHNRFFFCVSGVTDSFNRVILHKERFIDSVKVNVRKKKNMDDRTVHTNMVKAWSPRRGSLYKHRGIVVCRADVELATDGPV